MKKILIVFLLMGIVMLSGCKENRTVEDIYREGFSQYILETLELEQYDKTLEESEMRYIPNDSKHMKESQMVDRLGLTYIYLKNDIHTDRLTQEETELLLKEKGSNRFSKEVMDVLRGHIQML